MSDVENPSLLQVDKLVPPQEETAALASLNPPQPQHQPQHAQFPMDGGRAAWLSVVGGFVYISNGNKNELPNDIIV